MRLLTDGMTDAEGNISIPFHDIRYFSGLFCPYDVLLHSQPIQGIGVSIDRDDGIFVASAPSNVTGQDDTLHFSSSPSGMKEWHNFLTNNVPPKTAAIVCADDTFLQFMMDEYKLSGKESALPSLDELSGDERFIQIQFILGNMVSAYLSVLHGSIPGSTMLAKFLGLVALDPITYRFLTWKGMAHSAQDLVQLLRKPSFVTEKKIEMLTATSSNGGEMYLLARTDDTPQDVDPVQLGLEYFSTQSKYNHLPEPYRVKLTVLSICQSYAIMMGYYSKEEHDSK